MTRPDATSLKPSRTATLRLATPEATEALAAWLAPRLGPGDVVLLEGGIGAGKTHFARALIQTRLAAAGRHEDVPSPTFTLVQTYATDGPDIWHADLYRLTDPAEAWELGLDEAMETAICLVEWPDRLGAAAPARALRLHFSVDGDDEARTLVVQAGDERWHTLIDELARQGPGS